MDISNKTLGLLLVAAIVVSVGGTLISLNKLESVSPTGFAASDTGTVDLTIEEIASLILMDDSIDFGTCSLDQTRDSRFNSSLTQAGANNSLCDNTGSFPDFMTIQNDGNLGIVVTMNASMNGSTMFGSDSDWYYALSQGGGTQCNGTLTTAWTAVTSSLVNRPVCTWFRTYAQNGNSHPDLTFNFAARVAIGSTNANPLTLIFEATAA